MSRALVLRTCNPDMTSYNGFVWPESGPVECPDWVPTKECGSGLHGFLWGEGNSNLANWAEDAKWLVFSAEESEIIDLGGKIKCRRPVVEFCGDRYSATGYLFQNGGRGRAIIGITLTGGNGSKLTGGDRSTLTGGDRSTLTGGDRSTLTGGNRSTLTGGDGSTLTGGNYSMLTGGDGSTLTGGDRSTLTVGDYSTLTGGNGSMLTGGNGSKLTGGNGSWLTGGNGSWLTGGNGSMLTGGDGSRLTGGDGSKLTGGNGSWLTGGNGSMLICAYYDEKGRRRIATGFVEDGGLSPNISYRVNSSGEFVAQNRETKS